MKYLVVLFSLWIFANAQVDAFASGDGDGGWVSSGGELFRDAHNPWFVKNTENVYYCIKIDKSSISVEASEVKGAIQDALQYWKTEFGKADVGNGQGRFSLATQSFIETQCEDSKVDLRILFGYGSLSQSEIDYLKTPTKYIGITVRTKYDVKNLKGQGFIFISSDLGEHAYDNPGTLIEKAWGHAKILRYALMHEFGHVFGLPHMGTGLMAEVFLNQIIDKKLVEIYESSPVETFIQPPQQIDICNTGIMINRQFFGIPNDHACLSINQASLLGIQIASKKDEKSDLVVAGTIRNISPEIYDFSGRPASILQITDGQNVFTAAETVFRSFMIGPILTELGAKGNFVPTIVGPPKSVYLKISPTSLAIIGSNANKVEPVFMYNSPLGIKLLISPKP
jgi:hypothetical protein